jgi:hypothetical protein
VSEFHISNSKIEQVNESGNNYKIAGNNASSEQGSVVQTTGNENKVTVQPPKESFLATLWNKIKTGWKWLFG